ncbi:RnfABCDGE type electron transport complex subunit G [Clostridium fallax]|uniref:Ion-translocating oxidoreductase complex subunit G n=1 Tax=Clostridium fallax TaxID=1533 RepID=A0A1M4YZ98_9CLOT|nr:RnfABCDGE type electron transport complex subunit G [Clostridium fallax]SHF11143.1 electron transport complex, RnfABCDGE type, G subunit [Clostridium fallax]SQB07371.1 RnfABCDGE type electron transport complex subunit G [Clostridium fallax]
MKENIKLGIILLIITSIAGFCLSIANGATKDIIAENSKVNKEDLKIVLPGADKIKDAGVEFSDPINEVYEAYKGSEMVGYVIKVTSKGFHGPVDIMVAISKDDKLTGIKILSQSETPGVGAKVAEDKFTSRFKNIPIRNGVKMVKKAPSKDNEVESISGATISSNAVGKGVSEAVKFYMQTIKGEDAGNEKLEESTDGTSGASEETKKEEKKTPEKVDGESGASLEENKKEEAKSTDGTSGASEEESKKEEVKSVDGNSGASEEGKKEEKNTKKEEIKQTDGESGASVSLNNDSLKLALAR